MDFANKNAVLENVSVPYPFSVSKRNQVSFWFQSADDDFLERLVSLLTLSGFFKEVLLLATPTSPSHGLQTCLAALRKVVKCLAGKEVARRYPLQLAQTACPLKPKTTRKRSQTTGPVL